MTNQCRLSVIVPTSGRFDLAVETIQSLSQQTFKEWELIVTDDTKDAQIRQEIEREVKKFYDITKVPARYYFSEPGLGQANNTNQGLRHAKGFYIRILHSDDLLAPWALEVETSLMDAFSSISDVLFSDPVAFSNSYQPKNGGRISLISPRWLIKRMLNSGTALPSTMMFSRQAYESTSGLDPSYDFVCDWKFFYNILQTQVTLRKSIIRCEGGWVGWRVHPNSVSGKLWHTHFREHIKLMDEIVASRELISCLDFTPPEEDDFFSKANSYRQRRLCMDYLNLPLDNQIIQLPILEDVLSEDPATLVYGMDLLNSLLCESNTNRSGKAFYAYCIGKTFFEKNKITQAEKSLQLAVQLKPDFPNAWFILAKSALASENTDQSFKYFEKAVYYNPAHAGAYLEMGKIKENEGQLFEAAEYYKKSQQVDPKNCEAKQCLKTVLKLQKHKITDDLTIAKQNLKHGKLKEAQEFFQGILVYDPNNADAYRGLGESFYFQGKYQDAVVSYLKVIELEGTTAITCFALGNAFIKMQKASEALPFYQNALELKPDFPEAHNALGYTFYKMGKFEQAIDAFQQAVTYNPGFAEAFNNLGNAYMCCEEYSQAVVNYQTAISINKSFSEAYNGLGNAFYHQGKFNEAVSQFKNAINRKKDFSEAYQHLGNSYFELRRYQDALASYEQVIERAPDFSGLHFAMAKTYESMEQHEKALSEYKQAISKHDQPGKAYFSMGNLSINAGKFDQAQEYYLHALKVDPGNIQYLHALGMSYLRQNDLAHAIKAFDNALNIKTDYEPSQQQLQVITPFRGHYIDWRQKRYSYIVNYFGETFFRGKTVLELGAGYGDLGAMFFAIGCKVTSVEAREENVEIGKILYPDIHFIQMDLEHDFVSLGRFDIVLDVGLLYHLSDPALHIQRLANVTKEVLVLETEVCDSDDHELMIQVIENNADKDQSFSGVGSRPSPTFVEKALISAGFNTDPQITNKLNSTFHCYDWEISNIPKYQCGKWEHGLRRLWICRQSSNPGE